MRLRFSARNEGTMKRFTVIFGLMILLFSFSVTPGDTAARVKPWTGSRGWGPDTPYCRLYNGKTVETVEGIVTGVQRFIPGRGMSAGVRLLVRVGLDIVEVHLGPEWYVENQDITIQPKDQVEVKGSKVSFRGQSAIMASEVRKGDDVLKMRDENGFPAWIAWRHR
jgi:hypothetical protein